MTMITEIKRVWKSGNSLVISVSNDLVKDYNIRKGDRLKVSIEQIQRKRKIKIRRN